MRGLVANSGRGRSPNAPRAPAGASCAVNFGITFGD